MDMTPIDPTPKLDRIASTLDGDLDKARQVLKAMQDRRRVHRRAESSACAAHGRAAGEAAG